MGLRTTECLKSVAVRATTTLVGLRLPGKAKLSPSLARDTFRTVFLTQECRGGVEGDREQGGGQPGVCECFRCSPQHTAAANRLAVKSFEERLSASPRSLLHSFSKLHILDSLGTEVKFTVKPGHCLKSCLVTDSTLYFHENQCEMRPRHAARSIRKPD